MRRRFPVAALATMGSSARWFIDLLGIPDVNEASPVMIDGTRVGDIVFRPDLSADVFEKCTVDRPRDALPGEQGQGDIGDLHFQLPEDCA